MFLRRCFVLQVVGATLLFPLAFTQVEETEERSLCGDETELPEEQIWYNDACFNRSQQCPSGFDDPPLLLISLDGFRSDVLDRGRNPTLERLAECGAKAPFMRSTFPSATFPNHMTLLTGLFAESHGIIDSYMYDPVLNDTYRASSRDPKWWNVEPMWSTVERSGKKSATFFWPGSDVIINGTRPSRYFEFPRSKLPSLITQVEVVLSWLDLPSEERPAFMTLYSHEPDSVFHNFGPESRQGNESLDRVEKMFSRLMSGLHERKLLGCINIIVVSDHGMASSNKSKWIYLHKYANLTNYRSRMGTRTRLGPKEGSSATADELIKKLRCASASFVAYPKQWLPKRYHYSDHPRIDPVVLDLEEGYLTVGENQTVRGANGTHGYDTMLPSMRGFFLAYGKDFKQNISVRPFRNVEVYGLMTEVLNISARPNNGTPGAIHYILHDPRNRLPDGVRAQLLRECTSPEVQVATEDGCVQSSSESRNKVSQKRSSDTQRDRASHTPWGQPQLTVDNGSQKLCALYNKDYISGFDCNLKLPVWNAFTFDCELQKNPSTSTLPWHCDDRVSDITCNDYAALADCAPSLQQVPLFPPEFASAGEVENAFLNSNSLPLYNDHAVGVMQYMRQRISAWKARHGSINVVVGPAFDVHGNGKRPAYEDITAVKMDKPVPLASHVFFVITRCLTSNSPLRNCSHSDLDVTAFLLPNLPEPYSCMNNTERYVTKHMATVRDVETLTGLRFFADLPTYDAIRLRTQLPLGLWTGSEETVKTG